jgi:prepilin-type N-terminal cleavage/methylation domain-containing protein
MIYRTFRLLHKKETGLTLIEMLVSLAIMGIIGLGAAVASAEILNQTSRNTDYTAASRNAMNAIYWIGRDAQMAQVIAGSAGFPDTTDLSLAWEDWNNSSYNVTYSLEDGKLFRNYTVDGQSMLSLIAESINADPDMTNCSADNGTMILTITSSVGEGSKIVDVTRMREITPRPQL